jgi:hypothetical protein
LFIDTDGNAIDSKRQVPWHSAPEMIAYSYPYMLTLNPPAKGSLEVRNPDTLNMLQSISLPNVTFLHVPQPNISLAHAGKAFWWQATGAYGAWVHRATKRRSMSW